MNSRRRPLSSIDGFVRYRQKGSRSRHHIIPLIEFAKAELISCGYNASDMQMDVSIGYFFKKNDLPPIVVPLFMLP